MIIQQLVRNKHRLLLLLISRGSFAAFNRSESHICDLFLSITEKTYIFPQDVRRKKLVGGSGIKTVVINLGGGNHVGLQITNGVYVSGIQPGSSAAREGSLAVGDRILAVSAV